MLVTVGGTACTIVIVDCPNGEPAVADVALTTTELPGGGTLGAIKVPSGQGWGTAGFGQINPMVEFPPTTGGFVPFVTVQVTDLSCVPVTVNVRRIFSPVSIAAVAGVSCTLTPPAIWTD